MDVQNCPEREPLKETLEKTPRFVIYGNRTSGSDKVYDYLKNALGDMPDSEIEACRSVEYIEDAFFGRTGLGEPPTIEKIEKKASLGKRVKSRILGRKALPQIVSYSLNTYPRPDTLPQGVIVLPEMRQFDNFTHTNMSIATPTEVIRSLCEQYDVSVVIADVRPDNEALEEMVNTLAA